MVGVCIKYFHENYGGMLQAYATVSMLEQQGIEYELIRYEKRHTLFSIVRSVPRLLNGVLLIDKFESLLKKRGLKKHPEYAENEEMRKRAFQQFIETHFTKLSPVYKGYNALCDAASRYSAVVTGSDQLWSPAGLPTNYYNLKFVPDVIRKISYASSFGVKKIPWYQRRRTRNFLNRIEYISMRENSGKEIVRELTGRQVSVILDPVFMFDAEKWRKLVPETEEIKEPYIFAYFLGNKKESRVVVKKIAEELKCKIVVLRHLDQYVPEDEEFGDIALYDVGPDRFLNLLRGALYICTDSYHGCCFSIIHKKKFMVFNRYSESSTYSKNSRIDTLCEVFGLEQRRFNAETDATTQLIEMIDYEVVDEILEGLKRDAIDYLESAFDGIS